MRQFAVATGDERRVFHGGRRVRAPRFRRPAAARTLGPAHPDPPESAGRGPRRLPGEAWTRADARFEGRVGGGRWETVRRLPDRWPVDLDGLRFSVGCAPSGHTGLFPEQAAHWRWLRETLADRPVGGPPPRILNLFAYTGGASVALAASGARVTHVDASRPAIGWARENAAANGVSTIRWIQEDARRFVERARRRGTRYDGVLLGIRPPTAAAPPATGGWIAISATCWRPRQPFWPRNQAFFLVNVYTGGAAPADLERLLSLGHRGRLSGQRRRCPGRERLRLDAVDRRRLPTGIYARWRSGARWRGEPRAPLGRHAEQPAGELGLDEPARLRRRDVVSAGAGQNQLDQALKESASGSVPQAQRGIDVLLGPRAASEGPATWSTGISGCPCSDRSPPTDDGVGPTRRGR